ncbi:MAG: hypothetical protein CR963_00110 [Gammaproteobacteria bacterium]|nr:MAG: hypothetical protein CR963_00110 [Gammaproteobacteria bacterium]
MCNGWNKTPWGKGNVTIKLRGRELLLGMLRPRLVLFEAENLFYKKHRPQTSALASCFLLIDLYFPYQKDDPELDDLLELNECFRYFGMPYDAHAGVFKTIFGKIPFEYPGADNKSQLETNKNNLKIYFERWANLLELPVKYKGHYYRLFPKKWSENARNLSYNTGETVYDANWQITDDNRTFVWTAAFLDEGGKTLQNIFSPEKSEEKKQLQAKEYGHWLKLLNIDRPNNTKIETHQRITKFEQEWVDKRTYKRWESEGTWFGFSYHSGAVLAKGEYEYVPFSSYYFDSCLLLLYIRTTLFRFSSELTKALNLCMKGGKRRDRFEKIKEEFLRFTVLYQFPLLSNQQQHLEMYEINREFLEIDSFFTEVKQEIDNMHDFLESIESSELAKSAQKLTKLGIPLAAVGATAAVLGLMNWNSCINLFLVFVVVFICVIQTYHGGE